jgi:hypothetical protein
MLNGDKYMEIIFPFLYIFHQIISANFDLLYLFSAFVLILNTIQRKYNILFKSLIIMYFILLYSFIQLLLNNNIELTELISTISKLFLCFYLFFTLKYMNINMNIVKKILVFASILFMIFGLAGLFIKSSYLWRLHDEVNQYSSNRLKLFYTEPSELAFHIALVNLILFYIYLYIEKKMSYLILIIMNFIVMILSFAAGATVLFSIEVLIMFLYYFYLYRSKISITLFVIFIGILIILIEFFIFNESNSFYLRVSDILTGNDPSANYRLNYGFELMNEILFSTFGLGVGLGNLDTDWVKNSFNSYGIISNSFMYLIAESGFLAIVLLLFIIYQSTKTIRYKGKIEKVLYLCLFSFIMLYQIGGGYFTNPVNWLIYGFLANKSFNLKSISKVK